MSMLAIIAAIIFAIAWIINATGTATNAWFSVTDLLLIGLAATNTVGVWGYIGVVPLLTGAVGMCPLYSILGLNTCPMNQR